MFLSKNCITPPTTIYMHSEHTNAGQNAPFAMLNHNKNYSRQERKP